MKIGIIRCQEFSNQCAGFHCFPAIREKTGEFKAYETIEVVGFETCGGCGRNKPDKIIAKALKLKKNGAEVIHLGNCLVGVCPSRELYITALREKVGVPVIERTHERVIRSSPAPAEKGE